MPKRQINTILKPIFLSGYINLRKIKNGKKSRIGILTFEQNYAND